MLLPSRVSENHWSCWTIKFLNKPTAFILLEEIYFSNQTTPGKRNIRFCALLHKLEKVLRLYLCQNASVVYWQNGIREKQHRSERGEEKQEHGKMKQDKAIALLIKFFRELIYIDIEQAIIFSIQIMTKYFKYYHRKEKYPKFWVLL